MFGIFKRYKYSGEVKICLSEMISTVVDISMAHMIVDTHRDNWDMLIKKSVKNGITPEETALLLIGDFFYKGISILDNDIKEVLRRYILEKLPYKEGFPQIIIQLEFSVGKAALIVVDNKIRDEILLIAIDKIHNAIFDNDEEHFEDTKMHLFERSIELIKKIEQYKTEQPA